MGVRERSAAAGLSVGATLLGLPLLNAPPALPFCASPAEIAASRGHTRLVACRESDSARPLRGPVRRLFDLAKGGFGAFETPADLLRVHGIGPRPLARLTPWLAVESAREARCAVH